MYRQKHNLHTHTYENAHTHHGPPRFVEIPVKKKSFELDFEVRNDGEIPQMAGSEFQTVGAMELKERSPTDLRLRLGIFKSFSLEDRWVREV